MAKKVKTLVDLGGLKKVVVSSDLPDEFSGIVDDIEERATKEGGKSIHINITITAPKTADIPVRDDKGETIRVEKVNLVGQKTVIMFRIPRALTGRGQADMLLSYLQKLGFTDTGNLVGNKYKWQRHSLREMNAGLPASFTENPRHYPIEQLGQREIKVA